MTWHLLFFLYHACASSGPLVRALGGFFPSRSCACPIETSVMWRRMRVGSPPMRPSSSLVFFVACGYTPSRSHLCQASVHTVPSGIMVASHAKKGFFVRLDAPPRTFTEPVSFPPGSPSASCGFCLLRRQVSGYVPRFRPSVARFLFWPRPLFPRCAIRVRLLAMVGVRRVCYFCLATS